MERVLIVTGKFAPHKGGTSTVWTQWCACWPSEGLTVIAPWVEGCEAFDAQVAYRVIRIRTIDLPKIRMALLFAGLAAASFWECLWRRPRLIHFNHIFEQAFCGPMLRRVFGVPYFVHVYGEELVLAERFRWLRRLVQYVLRHASGVTAISHYTVALLRKFDRQADPLLVHPAVDGDVYTPGSPGDVLQRLAGVPADTPVLLTVGRLMERKGHELVLRVLPELVERFPRLKYLIAGVGPYEPRLRALAGDSPHVRFLGRVDDADLPLLFRAAKVFVHPNLVTATGDVEGFGIVFLEAAACGTPVLGGQNGGVPDAVSDGYNGFLVDPERPEELTSALDRLLSEPDLRAAMGENSVRWATGFSWKDAADRVRLYSQSRST